jgi:hypothetical protein
MDVTGITPLKRKKVENLSPETMVEILLCGWGFHKSKGNPILTGVGEGQKGEELS